MDSLFRPDLAWGAFKPRGFSKFVIKWCHSLAPQKSSNYKLIKILRGSLKKGKPKPFDVTIQNLKLRLITKGNFCETTALFAPQFYDSNEINWLEKKLETGGVFFDIGGNIGLYSLLLGGRLGGKIQIFTVEPDPDLYSRMLFNAKNNNIDINLQPIALSDYSGGGSIVISKKQRGENSLNTEGDGDITVKVTTLLDLCNECSVKKIDALKIDVEGHEHKILKHFFEHAPNSLWPHAIAIEFVHDQNCIVSELIDTYGYKIEYRSGRNVMLIRGD